MLGIAFAAVLLADCASGCPLPVEHVHTEEVDALIESGAVFVIEIEAETASGEPVHRSGGALEWGKKIHYGGDVLWDMPFDQPDYDVNSALLSPQKVWTSL